MMTNPDTAAMVRQALYLRNANLVLDDLDNEVHDSLTELLQEEIDGMTGWIRRGDRFGPAEWRRKVRGRWSRRWLLFFRLRCCGAPSDNWLLAAAQERNLSLAFTLNGSYDRPLQQISSELLEILKDKGTGLSGVRMVTPNSSRACFSFLKIPLTGVPLEKFVEACPRSDWKKLLREPLQEALRHAVKVQESISAEVRACTRRITG